MITREMLDSLFSVLDDAVDNYVGDQFYSEKEMEAIAVEWDNIAAFANLMGRPREQFDKLADEIRDAIPTDADRREAAGDDQYHADVEAGE